MLIIFIATSADITKIRNFDFTNNIKKKKAGFEDIFITAPQAAQMAQLVNCMFPNVAGRPAVYKTGGRVGKVDSKISQERGH